MKSWIAVALAIATISGCGGTDVRKDPMFRRINAAVKACSRKVPFNERHAVRRVIHCLDEHERSLEPDE